MPNQWFKFYGGEYLSDPKMLALSASERSCWLTLLCYASISEIPGEVRYLSEQKLMVMSGLDPTCEEWDVTKGLFEKFQKLGMIRVNGDEDVTVCNFRKKQEMALTGAERMKKLRSRDENVTSVTKQVNKSDARIEENRIDKNRVDSNIIILKSGSLGESVETPAQIAKRFFENQEDTIKILLAKGLPEAPVRREVAKFVSYWTEPNKSGTRERWQMEKTFEVSRRLATWFGRAGGFGQPQQDKYKAGRV